MSALLKYVRTKVNQMNHLCPHRYPFYPWVIWRDTIIVKCLAREHKGQDRDSNPHPGGLATMTWVPCTEPLGHETPLWTTKRKQIAVYQDFMTLSKSMILLLFFSLPNQELLKSKTSTFHTTHRLVCVPLDQRMLGLNIQEDYTIQLY